MSASERQIRVVDASLYFLPVQMRMPLKFGNQVVDSATCARARVTVETADGRRAEGWGETPLSVGWVWPAPIPYEERHQALKDFTIILTRELKKFQTQGHPLEIGHAFIETCLTHLQAEFNAERDREAALPHLAALVCFSLLDLAIYDAYGNLHGVPVFDTFGPDYLEPDLGQFLAPAPGAPVTFRERRVTDFLTPRQDRLPVWHLVGGLDPLEEADRNGTEPDDGYPVVLRDWIERDGLKCLKVKLRGNDPEWDYDRMVDIGRISQEMDVTWLTADFNCQVTDPDYVNVILDRLRDEHPLTFQKTLYVEQPFPYDLKANQIDVRSVSARKPLFMDESAHDWKHVRLGRELGWTGVALKTCKTLTGAILSLCWARAHGMTLMVQDLTNPMLAQIPHVLLAAHAGTIMGVESNAMQFYPEASLPEQQVHPGLYRRRNGVLDLSTLGTTGFGYRLDEIQRELPEPVV